METNKTENLKSILKGFGIQTSEDLDAALSEMLEALTIGIMTEQVENQEQEQTA